MFRDEARDPPERTIPRATYAAVIIIGAFYAITVWAFVVAIGPDQVGAVAQKTLDGEATCCWTPPVTCWAPSAATS